MSRKIDRFFIQHCELKNDTFRVNGVSIVSDVLQARDQAYAFANQIRDGSLLGATGKSSPMS